MRISFYEEFSVKENLDKIRLISFSAKLIVAANNIEEFNSLKNNIKKYKNKNIKEIIYWPVLKKEEGYWFSVFAKHSALKRTVGELKQNRSKLTIMWDAEIPILKKSLFFTQLPYYFSNRKMIREFFENSKKCKIRILTSEYPLENKFFRKILSNFFLVSFAPSVYGNKKIIMLYTSFFKNHPGIEKYLESQIIIGKRLFGKNFIVGLGCIATGIMGNEPLLTPEELERDLKIVKKSKIKDVVIFRLSGLNKKYMKIINEYTG